MKSDRVKAGAVAWDLKMGGRYHPHEVSELSGEVQVILDASDKAIKEDDETLEYIAKNLYEFKMASPGNVQLWEDAAEEAKVISRMAASIVIAMVLS